MSKPKREVTNCEFCDAVIDLSSPPNKRHYQEGRIEIERGVVLLARSEGGVWAAGISGFYCKLDCLRSRIAAARRGKIV